MRGFWVNPNIYLRGDNKEVREPLVGYFLTVNPFGDKHVTLDEEERRAGDIIVPLRYVSSIDALI